MSGGFTQSLTITGRSATLTPDAKSIFVMKDPASVTLNSLDVVLSGVYGLLVDSQTSKKLRSLISLLLGLGLVVRDVKGSVLLIRNVKPGAKK